MCGIFGLFGSTDTSLKKALALLNRTRGEDATGVVTVDNGELKWEKAAVDIKEILGRDYKYQSDKPHAERVYPLFEGGQDIFLAHTRRASPAIGKTYDHNCAHPFHYKGREAEVLGAHNGFVQNFEELQKKYAPEFPHVKDFDVDSQIIFFLLGEFGVESLRQIQGKAAVWWLDYKHPQDVFFWVWNQDFAIGKIGGAPAFSSELPHLMYMGSENNDNTGYVLDDTKGYLLRGNKEIGIRCMYRPGSKELWAVPAKDPYYPPVHKNSSWWDAPQHHGHNTPRQVQRQVNLDEEDFPSEEKKAFFASIRLPLKSENYGMKAGRIIQVTYHTGTRKFNIIALRNMIESVDSAESYTQLKQDMLDLVEGFISGAIEIENMFEEEVIQLLQRGQLPLFLYEEAESILGYGHRMDDIPMNDSRLYVVNDMDSTTAQTVFPFQPSQYYKLPDHICTSAGFMTPGFQSLKFQTPKNWNNTSPFESQAAGTVDPQSVNKVLIVKDQVHDHKWLAFPTKGGHPGGVGYFTTDLSGTGFSCYGYCGITLRPILVPDRFAPIGVSVSGDLLFWDGKAKQFAIHPVNTFSNGDFTLLEYAEQEEYCWAKEDEPKGP